MVAAREEGVELPGAGVVAGEVLEVTEDEEALEVTVGEEVLEALVEVVAVVVVAEDSEAVVVVSEAHNTSETQHLFFPTVFMRRQSCARDRRLQTKNRSQRRHSTKTYGLRALTSCSESLSFLIRSSCVLRVYNAAQGRVRARTCHK